MLTTLSAFSCVIFPENSLKSKYLSKNLYSLLLRTLSAVYEVVGHRDAQDKLKAEELFRILDENSDGKSG